MIIKINKKTLQDKQEYLDVLTGTKAYVELRKIVTKEGILDRSYGYYGILIFSSFFGFF